MSFIFYGIWNINGNRWVQEDSGTDFKGSPGLARSVLESMLKSGAAPEGLEIRPYFGGKLSV
jgi:hypothetical protein